MVEVINPSVFVDIQGFRSLNNEFILKEFCLIDGPDTYHYLVKSPYQLKSMSQQLQDQANWLTKHFHGLTFDSGTITLIQLKTLILPIIKDKVILVKGGSKVTWIKQLFSETETGQCINVEEFDEYMDRKKHLLAKCSHHHAKYKFHCAHSNVKAMSHNWHN